MVRVQNVCAGRSIIEGTRIGVHDVVGLIVNGSSVDDVVRSFPELTQAQVYECMSYYEDHRPEIDALVAEQMSESLGWTSFWIMMFPSKSSTSCVEKDLKRGGLQRYL